MSSTAIHVIITLYTASQEDTVVHSALVKLLLYNLCFVLHEKCPYSEFFGSDRGKIWTKNLRIRRLSTQCCSLFQSSPNKKPRTKNS